jgi:hypothetical protein
MPYYLRAINRENWPEPEDDASAHDLDADALNDLKTQDNALSVWYAENEDELRKAIVAYLASMDKWVELEEVDFIAIDIKDIETAKIEFDATPNFTYIQDYQDLHRDLTKLKYDSIEKLANIVIKSIQKGQDYIVDRGMIKDLFTEVVKLGKLQSENIDKSRHKKLQRLIIEIEKEMELDQNS